MTLYAVLNDFSGASFSLTAGDLVSDATRDIAALQSAGVQLVEIPSGKEEDAKTALEIAKKTREVLGSAGENGAFAALVASNVIPIGGGGGGVQQIDVDGGLLVTNPSGPTATVSGEAISLNVQAADAKADLAFSTATAAQASADAKLASIVAGTNVSVDNTDPANPVVSAGAPVSVTFPLSDPAGVDLVGFTDLFGPMVPLAAGPGVTARKCLVLWTFVGYNTAAAAPNPGDFVDSFLASGLVSDGGSAYGFGNRFVKGTGQTSVTSVTGFDVITVNPDESFTFVAASQAYAAGQPGNDVLQAVANWGPLVDGTKITFVLL